MSRGDREFVLGCATCGIITIILGAFGILAIGLALSAVRHMLS